MVINWLLWVGLFIGYFVLDAICAKNVIAIQRLKPLPAANTSSMMYLFGIIGTFICVKDSLINIVPIVAGAWLGTFFTVKWEIKILKKKKRR